MENNWELHHVGVVVRDMDKAVEYYQSLGIAAFKAVEYYQSLGIATFTPELILDSKSFTDLMSYGKPADPELKLKIKFAQIGSTTFEFLQPVEGESITKEFLNSRGEGVHHIAFSVDDLDKETDKLVKEGIKVIFSGKHQGGGFAYFETRKVGNVIIELMQRGK